jgi:hypothetical protein
MVALVECKGSEDGVYHSKSLDLWTLSIAGVQNS